MTTYLPVVPRYYTGVAQMHGSQIEGYANDNTLGMPTFRDIWVNAGDARSQLARPAVVPDVVGAGRTARPARREGTRSRDGGSRVFGYIVRRLFSAFLVVVLDLDDRVRAVLQRARSNPAEPLCDLNGKCTPEQAGAADRADGVQRPDGAPVRSSGPRVSSSTARSTSARRTTATRPASASPTATRGEVTHELHREVPGHHLPGGRRRDASTSLLGVLLGVIAARRRGTATDRGAGQSSALVSARSRTTWWPCWRGSSSRLQWQHLPGHVPTTRSPRTRPVVHGPAPALAACSGSTAPRRTPGTRAARWSRRWGRTTSAPRAPRACGAPGRRVKHALRAAIVPIVTIFGLDFAFLLAGTVFTEQIFEHRRHRRLGSSQAICVTGRLPGRRRRPCWSAAVHHRGGQPRRRHRLQPSSTRGCGSHDRLDQLGTDASSRRAATEGDPSSSSRTSPSSSPPTTDSSRPSPTSPTPSSCGKTLGIVGESGSGKSRVVDGGARPARRRSPPGSSGSIRVGGTEVDRRRRGHACADSAATTSR